MPYGKVAFVTRLSPRQPGYTMTVCAHEASGIAKRHIAISKLLVAIIDVDDAESLGLFAFIRPARKKEVEKGESARNGNFLIGRKCCWFCCRRCSMDATK